MNNFERIGIPSLHDKVISGEAAASLIKDGMTVIATGFAKAGDSKVVLKTFARQAAQDHRKIMLIVGASIGYGTDGDLASAGCVYKRIPFQVDKVMREHINRGDLYFVDMHLSEMIENLHLGELPHPDMGIIEISSITEDGAIVLTTAGGNGYTAATLPDKIILEINTTVPMAIKGLHDMMHPGVPPHRKVLGITQADSRIGSTTIKIDPDKIAGIVFTGIPDDPVPDLPPDPDTAAIAAHLVRFFEKEVAGGKLPLTLLPLQAGIGKVANAVLSGFAQSSFQDLDVYTEVLQDSVFELLEAGKIRFASGSSFVLSEKWQQKLFENIEEFKNKVILRPSNISNSPEIVRRLGIIAINTALEFDIYGNVNSTHVAGTHIMNGIGGSGDFARNAYMSIFVTPSICKGGKISNIVPMVSHVDHTEHDVDILVTEQGLADLRGLAPRERVPVIIEHCAHPDYKAPLKAYFTEALKGGGQTPHLLNKAFSWYENLKRNGSMQLSSHEHA